MNIPLDIKPLEPSLRYCSLDEFEEVFFGALEHAASETPCDVDRAVVSGLNIRANKLAIEDSVIDGLVSRFLSESATPSRVETVAWFLPAFWSADSNPDPGLAGLLTRYLGTDLPYAEVQEALILCLGRAFGLDAQPELKKQIFVAFQIVSRSSKYEITVPMVVSTLDRVLNSTEFTQGENH